MLQFLIVLQYETLGTDFEKVNFNKKNVLSFELPEKAKSKLDKSFLIVGRNLQDVAHIFNYQFSCQGKKFWIKIFPSFL